MSGTKETIQIVEALMSQMEGRLSGDPDFVIQIKSVTVKRGVAGKVQLSASASIYLRSPLEDRS